MLFSKKNNVPIDVNAKPEDIKIYFLTSAGNYTVHFENENGIDYLVAPVTMMVEGVHSGNRGPLLHLAEDLSLTVPEWENIPLTVYHPKNNDGKYVSVNFDADVFDSFTYGVVKNARMEDKALKAEAWIEVSKLSDNYSQLLEDLKAGKEVEVSTGVFSDEIMTPGVYNESEPYKAIAKNHVPDHLAILPDMEGACSIEDGCGIRVNQKEGGNQMSKELLINDSNEQQVLKELASRGFSVNQTGYYEIANKAQNALSNMEKPNTYLYIEEIFESELIFQSRTYDPNGSGRSVRFFKQSFQENAAGEVELTGEAVQVKRVVSYPEVKISNNSKTESKMSKCTDCVKKAVDNLIANKATAWSETDREFLEGLSEEQLEKFHPQPQANSKEDVKKTMSSLSTEEYLEMLPAQMREQVQYGLKVHNARKAGMIDAIVANASTVWTKDELEKVDMPMLEKLYSTINVNKKETVENEPDYSINGLSSIGVNSNDEDGIEPMYPVEIEFK